MLVKAVTKDTGVSPLKARMVVNLIRGKSVDEALTMLKFVKTPVAGIVAKTIKSAAANAENNYQMDPAQLRVSSIMVGEARKLKRYRPQARGRTAPILKRSSHVTVFVTEEEK